MANDALEQGFALVTCIGPGLSIDLLLLYPPDVEQRRLVFYFSSIGGEGRGDLSGTVTPHRRVSIESTGNWILNRVTHGRVLVVE